MPPRGGHGGGGGRGGHRGGHHHGGHRRGGGWGGPIWGGYPYPSSPDVFIVEDEDPLEKRLKELEILEKMKKLGLKGFEMPSTNTLALVGAALIGAYLLLRKRR